MSMYEVSKIYENSVSSDRFPWKIGIPLYVLSYGFMFGFLDSYFWDDWYVNVKLSVSEAHSYWKDNLGFFPTNRFVEVSLLGRNPVIFHLLTFAIFMLIPVVAFNIAKQLKLMTQEQRVIFAVFLLVLPINSARVSMACFRLSYSLLLFLCAWLLLIHPRMKKVKYLSAPLFIVSFLAQSLIPFFVLPCLHSAYQTYSDAKSKPIIKAMARFSYFFIAPVYLLIAWIFSPPVDSRREYYTPGASGIIRAIIVLIVVMLLMARSLQKSKFAKGDNAIPILYSVSLVAIGFGAAAYIASGRLVDISEWMMNFVPRASDWESRHQLLLGIGISLFFSTLAISMQQNYRKRFFFGIISICVILNVSMMQGYFLDAKKQNEAIEIFSEFEDISSWNSVVVIDEAVVYNARNRKVRSYEWEQMIVEAGGSKNVSVVTSTYPCTTTANSKNAVLLLVESSRGRFTSMIKNGVGLRITKSSVLVCE